jgi:hypothetical protein
MREDREMKTEYTLLDIMRAREWYFRHEAHVDQLIIAGTGEWPMSGSDISRPELWKPAGWRWFFKTYGKK